MLDNFDFYDLHVVLINIRRYPNLELNKDIVHNIIHVLEKNDQDYKPNQIRAALKSLDLFNIDGYKFVYVTNFYPYIHRFIKKQNSHVLYSAFRHLFEIIKTSCFEQVEDLADALHNLPIVLLENNFKLPKSYVKLYLNPYYDKWKVDRRVVLGDRG